MGIAGGVGWAGLGLGRRDSGADSLTLQRGPAMLDVRPDTLG